MEQDKKGGIETLSEFLGYLKSKGVDHIAYYHYTQWSCFGKMLTPVAEGPARGRRMLILTNTSQTNDGLEEKWHKRYYMACFSLSRYEDVAMWLNYGKKSPNAVRVKFTRDAIEAWRSRRHLLCRAEKNDDGYSFTEDVSRYLRSADFYGVAYVIPSAHWVDESDGIRGTKYTDGRPEPDESRYIVQDGNVENGRDFHKVAWNGRLDWVDKIYNREDLSQVDIPPVFKKRGWAYEREIRLVVELAGDAPEFPQRLGISFDEPLAELERHMRMTQKEREETAMDSKWTPCIKIWDRRFPMLQSGPWFDEARASDKAICGFKLKDAHKSEYENEIRMFDLISGKDCGCSA